MPSKQLTDHELADRLRDEFPNLAHPHDDDAVLARFPDVVRLARMAPMPSNESAAFDVLRADHYRLCAEYSINTKYANDILALRADIVAALQKPGTPEMGRAEVARARLEGDGDAVQRFREKVHAMPTMEIRGLSGVAGLWLLRSPVNRAITELEHELRDREYSAPVTAECRLSDGSVVTLTKGGLLSRSTGELYAPRDWPLLIPDLTGADFDALKAFATTRTEDRRNG